MESSRCQRRSIRAAIAICLVVVPLHASAANDRSVISPPDGNIAFFTTKGVGTQDYICLPSMPGSNESMWSFERPQALLFATVGGLSFEAAEHFLSAVPGQTATPAPGCTESGVAAQQLCPTWRSALDQSAVWGEKMASVTAGTASDCPNTGSIACLLLRSVATSNGVLPKGLFGSTTYIVRANTLGGSAPATACRVGQIAQVPYSADYVFYAAAPSPAASPVHQDR